MHEKFKFFHSFYGISLFFALSFCVFSLWFKFFIPPFLSCLQKLWSDQQSNFKPVRFLSFLFNFLLFRKGSEKGLINAWASYPGFLVDLWCSWALCMSIMHENFADNLSSLQCTTDLQVKISFRIKKILHLDSLQTFISILLNACKSITFCIADRWTPFLAINRYCSFAIQSSNVRSWVKLLTASIKFNVH